MAVAKSSPLVDTRVVYCGDNLDQLRKLPAACVDLIYIDPPFNSNRNYEVFRGETKEKRAFEDRHENTRAYIDYMRPRCAELSRVLKKTGTFYYHCDDHASHYVKVMLDRIFGENNFLNEVIWQRTGARGDAKGWNQLHDTLFVYGGGGETAWNPQFEDYSTREIRAVENRVLERARHKQGRLRLFARGVVGADQQITNDRVSRVPQGGDRDDRGETAAVLADVGQLVDASRCSAVAPPWACR